MKLFDRVVLSANEDPKFLDFWPIVSQAWRKLFDVEVSLAFLTNREHHDLVVARLREFGDVHVFKPIPGIPQPNLAKVIRHILASTHEDERVLINDIDLLPLQTNYLTNLLSNSPRGTLVTTGKDLYTGLEQGKFMMGNMTALGWTFHNIINPEDLTYPDLIDSWIGQSVFDHKEDIASTIHHENPDCFSDESLFRALLHQNPQTTLHFNRGYTDGQAIDRSHWKIDQKKLERGEYIEAHLLRPYSEHKAAIQPLIDYLEI
jgi:hypothetical protein